MVDCGADGGDPGAVYSGHGYSPARVIEEGKFAGSGGLRRDLVHGQVLGRDCAAVERGPTRILRVGEDCVDDGFMLESYDD